MKSSYLPNTDQDRNEMLQTIGVSCVDDLFTDIPGSVALKQILSLPTPVSEPELIRLMAQKAEQNVTVDHHTCFLGAGAYDHIVPAVVRHLAFRSEFYTAYTQYQAEISQGYLQALWEYQSFICELTGMDVSNASLYDGATALAEAMHMVCIATNRHNVLVSQAIHPHYRRVLTTYAKDLDITLIDIPTNGGVTDWDACKQLLNQETAGVLLQSPNFYGCLEMVDGLADQVHQNKGLLVMCNHPLALAVIKTPAEYGADIAVGEGQPLGLGLNFGGPYLGFMATRDKWMRRMPGRMIGQTHDQQGHRGFVLTLQAREQHIRREKASSNICSNEGLCALMACIYCAAVGKQGIQEIAHLNIQKAHYAAQQIEQLPNCSLAYTAPYFNEFVINLPLPVATVNEKLLACNIIGGYDLGLVDKKRNHQMLLCVTEKRTIQDIHSLVQVLEGLQ